MRQPPAARVLATLAAIAVLAATLAASVSSESGVDATFLTFATLSISGPAAVALYLSARSGGAGRSVLLGFAAIAIVLFGITELRSPSTSPSLVESAGAAALVFLGIAVIAAIGVQVGARSPRPSLVLLSGLSEAWSGRSGGTPCRTSC